MSLIYLDYDSIIRAVCPRYEFFLKTMAYNIPSNIGTILNLGTGSGNLEKEIFALNPKAKIYGIDIDSKLLSIAKQKLKRYNFYSMQGNLLNIDWPVCNVIVSSITLHHLEYVEQKNLFKKIYLHLPKNGFFMNYDYALPKNKKEREKIHLIIKENMLKQGFKEDFINRLEEETGRKDRPMLLENHRVLLEDLGFNFNLLCEKFNFVLYKCYK